MSQMKKEIERASLMGSNAGMDFRESTAGFRYKSRAGSKKVPASMRTSTNNPPKYQPVPGNLAASQGSDIT
jgi:hypothetical protein